jgi:carboxylesterase type B
MGESAGAMTVGNMINTYPDNPPFRAGVMMSGSSVAAPQGLEGIDASSEEWTALLALVNCANLSSDEERECMRTADADTIVEAINENSLQFGGLTPDNKTLLSRPDLAWADGNVAHVPILIGSNADEASAFLIGPLENIDESIVEQFSVGEIYSEIFDTPEELTSALDDVYQPGSSFAMGANTTVGLVSQAGTDFVFRCTSTFVANLTSTLLSQPTWQYVFDAVVPSNTWPQWPELGAWHASEIALIFGTYTRNSNTTQAEADLSRSLQKQFADFVKDPQRGPGWEQWPTIAVLGVDEDGAVTTSEDASERDAVCSYYYPEYLRTLPALVEVSGSGGTETGPGSEQEPSSGDPEASAGVKDASETFALGLSILLMVSVTLWV